MSILEIKLPQIDGAELKSVTTDLEKGYVVAEYGEKKPEFKKGDICKVGSNEIHIFDSRRKGSEYQQKFFNRIAALIGHNLYYDVEAFGYFGEIHRLATPEEQQTLFDALAKKGKKWNPDTLEIEDIEQRILVPESIGIYRLKTTGLLKCTGDNLVIAFNNNKQCLGSVDDVYFVDTLKDSPCYEKVQCYLQPCKREDIKAGDTWVGSNITDIFNSLCYYCKALLNNKHAYIINGMEVYVNGDADWKYYYKLIPVE